MRMILAIDNKKVEEALSQIYVSKYEIYIVNTKELILTTIINEKESIIIIREDLNGNINTLDLIDEIRKINNFIRIIVIVKKITKAVKEQLYSKEIFNIIEGNSFKLKEIVDAIDSPKILENTKIEKSVKEKIIFVIGSSSSGKTIFSKLLAYSIAKDTRRKVLVIDMDYINPTLDLYVKGKKNYSFIDYIKDVISLNVKEIINYETTDEKYSNIKYLLNQKCIGIPNDEITLRLFQTLKNYYDYIIVDTSTFLLEKMYQLAVKLDANVVYMIEPNICIMKNLNRKILLNSIVVLNNYRKNKDISKYIKNNMDFQICESIKKYKNISKEIIDGKTKIKFKNIENKIGIVNYTRFQKLIKKIVFKEEVK